MRVWAWNKSSVLLVRQSSQPWTSSHIGVASVNCISQFFSISNITATSFAICIQNLFCVALGWSAASLAPIKISSSRALLPHLSFYKKMEDAIHAVKKPQMTRLTVSFVFRPNCLSLTRNHVLTAKQLLHQPKSPHIFSRVRVASLPGDACLRTVSVI